MVFTLGPSAHLPRLATLAGLGTISGSSGIVGFGEKRCRRNLPLHDLRSMDAHIEADLYCFPESDGGRRSPFFSGYRPCFRFGDIDNGVTITLLDRESMTGGDTGRVSLSFHAPHLQAGRLSVGAEFSIAEGARVVARGTMTVIHDSSMMVTSSPAPD